MRHIQTTIQTTIHTIALPIVNAFLLRGERAVLVDTGAPGDGPAILRAAAALGVAPRDIGLILLTHGHVDHFGAAAWLRQATGAPLAAHPGDLPTMRSGRNPDMRPASLEGKLYRPFVPWQTAPVEPDIVLDGSFDLAAYGVGGEILPTPGHSPGSVSLRIGGDMLVGDMLRGGYLVGRVAGGLPLNPYYIDDADALRASLARALDTPAATLHVGHGRAVAADSARRRLSAGRISLAPC